MVTLHTNYGDIVIDLDHERTPNTAQNFLQHANSGYFQGTIFHRVIPGFMIQGGGMDANLREKPKQTAIQNEADKGQANKRGTVAMARTSDPHSASTQFFINVVDNDFLNFSGKTGNGWGYCVFGTVVEGMDVADKIARVATTSRAGHQDVPVEGVVVERVTVTE